MSSSYVLPIVAILFYAILPNVHSYSAGAPKEACVDLTPQHEVPPQSSPVPYTLAASGSSVKAGEAVEFTIRGNSPNQKIKGFMGQVRLGDTPVGTFTPGPNSQAVDCSGAKDTITHTKIGGDGVNEVHFTWNAPSDLKGPVSFVATVAQNGGVFWVGKLSQSLTLA